jgi:hypothetical protein
MSTLSIENAPNLESATAKKRSAKSNALSRRKVTSATVVAKKPPRSVVSKAERAATAKIPRRLMNQTSSESPTRSACSLYSAGRRGLASKR